MLVSSPKPVLLTDYFVTALARSNSTLLVPWRLLAMAVHLTSLITVTDYREEIVRVSVPTAGATQSDIDLVRDSTRLALAATFVCIAVSFFALLTARTLKWEGLNFIVASGHTIAGVLLLHIWLNTAHSVRLWHTFFVFTLPPALCEAVALVSIRMRGAYLW